MVDLEALGGATSWNHAAAIPRCQRDAKVALDRTAEGRDRPDVARLVEHHSEERIVGEVPRHRDRDRTVAIDLTALTRTCMSAAECLEVDPNHHIAPRRSIDDCAGI